jgi:hypothetical protein
MTVLEMHVQLDLLCQKLNSNVYGNLLPEEKDIILNKAQIRFIREVSDPTSNQKGQGFQYTQARYDDIEELLTSVTLPSYKYVLNANVDESVFSIVPYNYFRLVKLRSFVKDLCGANYNTTVQTTAVTNKVYHVPFTNTSSLFTIFSINIDYNGNTAVELFDITDYPSFTGGLSSNEEKFILIQLILSEVNNKLISLGLSYRLYYETYDTLFIANNFLLVGDSLLTGLQFVIGEAVIEGTLKNLTYTKVSNNLETFKLVNHRVTKSNDSWKLLDTSFGTTIAHSPLTDIEKRRLISYHQKKFIIGDTILQYIRKPRNIDVLLSIDCELNPNVHDKVVDLAARLVGSYLNTDNQRQLSMENLLKE